MMTPSVVKLLATILCAVVLSSTVVRGASSDRVLLRDVNVLTLRDGRMTSGRRSSPVPQLQCVGGSAKGYFTPSTVQCYNRGSDGDDVQWECKADMDNSFRFGSVEVTCEGYDYPDDPFILKGSCGLEYTLDLTEEGRERYKQQKSHHYDSHYNSWSKKSSSGFGDLLFFGGVALVIYIIYKSCLAPNTAHASAQPDPSHRPHAPRDDPPPPYRDDPPPAYGFRQEYMSGSDSCSGSSSYGGNTYNAGTSNHNANQGGGFWSGAATGGVLGYLFGRNSGQGGYTHYQQPHSPWGGGYQHRPHGGHSSGWFSGWGSGGRTSYGGSSSSSSSGSSFGGSRSSSSGTRTASGFGGTKRR